MSNKTIDQLMKDNLPKIHTMNVDKQEGSIKLDINTPQGEKGHFSLTVLASGDLKAAAKAIAVTQEYVNEAGA